MTRDMVFDRNMNPAYVDTPELTKRWLEYQMRNRFPLRDYSVRVGTTMKFVSIPDYLNGKKS